MKLGPHTVTVVRAGPPSEDPFGNPVPGWGAATSTTVTGCSVQPVPGVEVIVGRETVVSRWQLFAPAGTDMEATDRVVYSGDTYEVDGEVERWSFPPLSHLVALLRRSESS